MKKRLFLASLFLVVAVLCSAAPKHSKYIKTGTPGLATHYPNWNPGSPYPVDSIQGDENFFISRVKYKKRFTSTATQANNFVNPARKVMWWCPIGEGGWTSLPAYSMDMEPFSMWSYMDIWGNWTEGFLRHPGALADVCHKNGVVSAVVSQPGYGANLSSDGNGAVYQKLMGGVTTGTPSDDSAKKFLKIMRYYGIDGIGFNSECNFSSYIGIQKFFAKLHKFKGSYGMDHLHIDWYDGVLNNGSGASFSEQLYSGNQNWFNDGTNPVCNGFFLNYNSFTTTRLNTSVTTANNFTSAGSSSWDVYASLNMQGNGLAAGNDVAYAGGWTLLPDYNLSIGIWGAHNMNMLWESAGENGSSPIAKQTTYLAKQEMVFTGGTKNPVTCPAVTNSVGSVGLSALPSFHGFAKFVAAKSSLSWILNGYEPFVTYFNLGIGTYFNNEGNTTFPKEWYNIGMQDYLPTWRWWITTSFMGRTATSVPAGVSAEFTFDDAWFGGSCLKVKTTAASSFFLHLFKTQFPLASGATYNLKIRYKVTSGTAKGFTWALSNEGSETTAVNNVIAQDLTASNQWVEKELDLNSISNKTLALIALRFVNTSADFEILIGEVSLMKEGVTYNPIAPTITSYQHLSANYAGEDFKIIFKSKDQTPANLADGIPVYNSDVDTWYFEIWSQQDGEEPVLCTTTTSWAAYVVGAPFNTNGIRRFKYGVRAVAPDGVTKSAITWSNNWSNVASLVPVEGITLDKPVIKKNEEFTISLTDTEHASVSWVIKNSTTGTAVTLNPNTGTGLTLSLPTEGSYDVQYNYVKNGTAFTYSIPALIQISSDATGAMPRINNISSSPKQNFKAGQPTHELYVTPNTATSTANLNYGSRNADGSVSQALRLEDTKALKPGKQTTSILSALPFTVSFWMKLENIIGDQNLFGKRLTTECWSCNGWGEIWTTLNANGTIGYSFRNSGFAGVSTTTAIAPGAWVHVAFSASDSGSEIYLNGVRQATGTKNTYFISPQRPVYIGGTSAKGMRPGMNGWIDDFQIWNKKLTASEVQAAMQGYTNKTIPTNLQIYYDFEKLNEDGTIKNLGAKGNTDEYTGRMVTFQTSTLTQCRNDFTDACSGLPTEGILDEVPLATVRLEQGNPALPGSFPIKTTPTWTLEGAPTQSNSTYTPTSGSVEAYYPVESTDGGFQVKLTLKNPWGSDVKILQQNIFVLDGTVGLDGQVVENMSVYPNPFADFVLVQFAKGGDYDVKVFDMSGKLLSVKQLTLKNQELVQLDVDAEAGTYIVRISQQGKVINSVKVLKK